MNLADLFNDVPQRGYPQFLDYAPLDWLQGMPQPPWLQSPQPPEVGPFLPRPPIPTPLGRIPGGLPLGDMLPQSGTGVTPEQFRHLRRKLPERELLSPRRSQEI